MKNIERNNYIVTIKDLEREYNKHNLTEFLKTCSKEELDEYINLILSDDILGIRSNIYDALLTEIEYRKKENSYINAENEYNSTVYQKIAKSALINWNGLNAEEANKKIQTNSISELESQVYAMNTIKHAVNGIAKLIGLTGEEAFEFFVAIIEGPINAKIFETVSSKAQNLKLEESKLNVLSAIHNGWVKDNSSEKTFNKKVDRKQLRQYAPLELIGWNEVRSDLLFLSPILESIGININEETLASAYHTMLSNYLYIRDVNGKEDLTNLIKYGSDYYAALPKELEMNLLPMSETMSEQIIENWKEKDLETYEIFNDRIRKYS